MARRDWKAITFELLNISTKRVSVEEQIQPEDEGILCIAPTAQEVLQIEKLCNAMGENRPVVLFNPRLEDVSIVGIGYAGRQLRDRFLKNMQSCYYLRLLEEGTLFRCYPGLWQVWRETTDGYELIKELPNKPVGDDLDLIFAGETATSTEDAPKPKKLSIFAGMQRFMKALSRYKFWCYGVFFVNSRLKLLPITHYQLPIVYIRVKLKPLINISVISL